MMIELVVCIALFVVHTLLVIVLLLLFVRKLADIVLENYFRRKSEFMKLLAEEGVNGGLAKRS